jgi:hypothetical protein
VKRGGKDAPPEERGDCFDACLASVLETELAACRIEHGDEWWESAETVARRHGHVIFEPYRLGLLPEGTEPFTASVLGT